MIDVFQAFGAHVEEETGVERFILGYAAESDGGAPARVSRLANGYGGDAAGDGGGLIFEILDKVRPSETLVSGAENAGAGIRAG